MGEDPQSLENHGFPQISQLVLHSILSDQNGYTHLKPLRNQGFQRFYALFFKACFIDTQSQLRALGRT